MKKFKYLLVIFISFITISGFGQMLAPEDPGGEPGNGDDPIGGGAPIGSGIIILLSLGSVYGGKKIYDIQKENRK